MWTRLAALCLGLAFGIWSGGACAQGQDQPGPMQGAAKDRPVESVRTKPGRRSADPLRSEASKAYGRPDPVRPQAGTHRAVARTTHCLIDGTETLELPAPARNLAVQAAHRYWRITPFRHSRLPASERPLDVLLTLITGKASEWLAALAEEEGRSGAPIPSPVPPQLGADKAPPGPVSAGLWAGPRKRWPGHVGVHEARRALLLPAQSRWVARAQVPPGATLQLALSPILRGQVQLPLRVTVTARPQGGEPRVLVTRELGPKEAGRFLPHRFDLADLAGREVRFEVAVAASTSASPRVPSGFIALVRPRLESEGLGGPLNLMLVILDTVRLDALGSHGQRRVLTPALDALAARGMRFTNAFSNASWTRPSLMSLLSARHPGAAGSTPLSFFPHEPDLALVRSGTLSTLPDHLERQGYRVRALAQNYFMLPEEQVGADFGFSSFAHVLLRGGPHRADNPTLTAAAEQFLLHHRDHRFFFFLHYESAHAPYNPPKEDLDVLRAHLGPKARISIEDKYRGEVMALDRLVARLVVALETQGLLDRTLLVVTSDHGETLDRVHCFYLPKLTYNTCYGHSPSLYDEVLRVPLILVGPGLRPGQVVTQITRHVDLAPTLLDLLGLPPLPGAEGMSVAPWLRGARADEPREVYAAGRGAFALRRGPWKYIWRAPFTRSRTVGGKPFHVVDELYDLQADPQEHRNLAPRRPEVVRELREALFALMRKDRFPVGPAAPRLPARRGHRLVVPPPGVR